MELGINCVELLPVLEYDELEFQRTPNPRDHMVNIWGYSHISFMAPMSRFAVGGAGDLLVHKRLCQELHELKTFWQWARIFCSKVAWNSTCPCQSDPP